MTNRRPQPGDVFRYPFLKRREANAPETSRSGNWPVCVAVSAALEKGVTIVFVLPITTVLPRARQAYLEVPPLEARKVGLRSGKRAWVLLDELNVDDWERSHLFTSREPLGAFGPAFTSKIVASLAAVRGRGRSAILARGKSKPGGRVGEMSPIAAPNRERLMPDRRFARSR